ncbi:hypothetical protein V8F06_010068, partial [Rhypophila decipiens]
HQVGASRISPSPRSEPPCHRAKSRHEALHHSTASHPVIVGRIQTMSNEQKNPASRPIYCALMVHTNTSTTWTTSSPSRLPPHLHRLRVSIVRPSWPPWHVRVPAQQASNIMTDRGGSHHGSSYYRGNSGGGGNHHQSSGGGGGGYHGHNSAYQDRRGASPTGDIYGSGDDDGYSQSIQYHHPQATTSSSSEWANRGLTPERQEEDYNAANAQDCLTHGSMDQTISPAQLMQTSAINETQFAPVAYSSQLTRSAANMTSASYASQPLTTVAPDLRSALPAAAPIDNQPFYAQYSRQAQAPYNLAPAPTQRTGQWQSSGSCSNPVPQHSQQTAQQASYYSTPPPRDPQSFPQPGNLMSHQSFPLQRSGDMQGANAPRQQTFPMQSSAGSNSLIQVPSSAPLLVPGGQHGQAGPGQGGGTDPSDADHDDTPCEREDPGRSCWQCAKINKECTRSTKYKNKMKIYQAVVRRATDLMAAEWEPCALCLAKKQDIYECVDSQFTSAAGAGPGSSKCDWCKENRRTCTLPAHVKRIAEQAAALEAQGKRACDRCSTSLDPSEKAECLVSSDKSANGICSKCAKYINHGQDCSSRKLTEDETLSPVTGVDEHKCFDFGGEPNDKKPDDKRRTTPPDRSDHKKSKKSSGKGGRGGGSSSWTVHTSSSSRR